MRRTASHFAFTDGDRNFRISVGCLFQDAACIPTPSRRTSMPVRRLHPPDSNCDCTPSDLVAASKVVLGQMVHALQTTFQGVYRCDNVYNLCCRQGGSNDNCHAVPTLKPQVSSTPGLRGWRSEMALRMVRHSPVSAHVLRKSHVLQTLPKTSKTLF